MSSISHSPSPPPQLLQELESHLQRDRESWATQARLPPSKRGHMLMDESSKHLSIIMPAYNEEKRLAKTLDVTLKYLGACCALSMTLSSTARPCLLTSTSFPYLSHCREATRPGTPLLL